MAFFGSDGLEHQLKQIKAQLASKDYEISSVRNELRKKDDELVEARKQRESTSYRLQEEEAKAHQAETALKQRTTATTLRLQHDNLQAAHRDQSNKVKAGEKENGRLQYDVDALGATNEEGRRLQQECITLQGKVKDLERQLCRAKEDHEAFRAEASSSHKTSKRPNVDFFGAALSPASKRGNRRRSTSLSSDNRLSELEAEVEMLRSAQGPSSIDLDKLKTQLMNAKKELDKVTNAKLALERSSAREMEELKSRLEDANFELEDWRRNDGSGSKAGIEKAKKAARQELDVLSRKIEGLEGSIREKERALEELPVLEAQIGDLRTALSQAQASADGAVSSGSPSEASAELCERIAELEKELAASRTSAPPASLPADKTSRQLQREISKLKGQITGLEEELATQDDEILRLRGALPLPGSPSLTATKSIEDILKVEMLEGQLEETKAQVTEAREKLEIAEERNEALLKQLEDASTHQAALEVELAGAKSDLATKMTHATAVEAEILAARDAASAAQEELRLARTSADDAQAALLEHQQQLAAATLRCAELETTLAGRSDLEAELTAARSSLAEQTRVVAEVEETLKRSREAAAQQEESTQSLMVERDAVRAEVQSLKDNVNDLITRLADEEDRSKAAVASAAEKKAYIKYACSKSSVDMTTDSRSVKEKYKEAIIERDGIQLRLADAQDQLAAVQTRAGGMQDKYEEASKARLDAETALDQLREEVANRSTESQARERDLELVNQRAEAEQLNHALDALRNEHKMELELAAFAAEQDLQAAKAQLLALQDKVEASIEAKRNLAAASDKIRQLRAERDQLRTTLHFVNHEQRFTSEEAATHRTALEAARTDLEERSNAICKLQSEYDDAKTTHGHVSAELEADLAQAQAARDASVQQVSDLELRLQDESKQAISLVNDLRGARDRALHAEIELSKMSKVYKQMEADYDFLKLQLDAKLEAAVKAEREAPAVCESPKSTMSEGTRQRRASGLPSPSWDMVVKLKEANASFRDRVERRDVHIRNIENELKQAKVNLQLAQDAAEENMADSQDRNSEISQKEAALLEARETMERQTVEARSALDAMRLRAETFETISNVNARSLQEVIVALAAEHHKARANASAWNARMAVLRSADEGVDRIQKLSTQAMATATDRIVQLSEQVQHLESQAWASEAALSATREQEMALRADLQAQLDSAGAIEATLRKELGELEASLAERNTQLDEARSSRAELEAALGEAKAHHERLFADAEERILARQSEVSELLEKLAAADKHRGATEEDIAARQASADELERVRSDMESLQSERDTLLESLQDLERTHADLVREHEDAHAAKDEELRIERQSVQDRIHGFEADLQEKVTEIARLALVVEELEGAMADLRLKLSDADALHETDQTTIASVQGQLAEVEERATTADNTAADLAKEVALLQASVQVAEAAVLSAEAASRAVQEEVETLRRTNMDLQTTLAAMKDTPISGPTVANTDLQERVQELESSLTLKVQEVEEADDRVREALKDKGKLEKKVAKLQRQLAAATAIADPETAANTAANKRISQQVTTATPMAPPPRPVPASAPAISAFAPKVNAPAPSPRQPLRSVNILMDAKPSPGGGLKRAREERGEEKPLPAECILLPPAQLEGATPRSMKAVPRFKPQRTVSGDMGTPRTRINIFSGDS